MNLAELRAELNARGIRLLLRNGKLRYQPVAPMTPGLLAGLAEHKAELIAELRESAIERLFGPTAVLTGSPVREGPGTSCNCCYGTSWWRLRGGSHWVCPTCHPPQAEPEEIELVTASAARVETQERESTAPQSRTTT